MKTTHIGTVRDGKVEFDQPLALPEGRQVRVTLSTLLSKQEAVGKANVWLANHVGDAVGALNGVLISTDHRVVWRFEAFITGAHIDAIGPIGQFDIDADTGEVVVTSQLAEAMIERGRQLVSAA